MLPVYLKYRRLVLYTVAWLTLDQGINYIFIKHWPSAVNYYDRLFSGSLLPWLKEGIALLILIISILYLQKQRIFLPIMPVSLILAGMASNALSLWIYSRFIDYIPLGFFVTNGADLMLTAGLFSLGYLLYKRV